MYQFHYDYLLKTFRNVKLLFTDTDSLVYEIKKLRVVMFMISVLRISTYLISVDIVKTLFIMIFQIKKCLEK